MQVIATLADTTGVADHPTCRMILAILYALNTTTNLPRLLKAEHNIATDWQLHELWHLWSTVKPTRDLVLSRSVPHDQYTFLTNHVGGVRLLVWKYWKTAPLNIAVGRTLFTLYNVGHHANELYTFAAPMSLTQWLLLQVFGTGIAVCGTERGATGLVRILRDKNGEVKGLWFWWHPVHAIYYGRAPYP